MNVEKVCFGKNGATVVIDGKEYTLDEDCVLKYGINVGLELNRDLLLKMLNESDVSLCKKYLFKQINSYSKTEKGYKTKLFEKNFSHKAINEAVAYFKETGYIDDRAFAEKYYEKYKNKKGVRLIIKELKNKGVSDENLNFIDNAPPQTEEILILAEKFMRKREKTKEECVKLIRHLASKGFSYDEIMSAVNSVMNKE